MSEEHLIRRDIGIVLAIACIILFASLVVTFQWGFEEQSILNLNKSTVWINQWQVSEEAGSNYTYIFSENVPYAGYIAVDVLNSTSDKTYVHVDYSNSENWFWNDVDIVGYNETAVFPVGFPVTSVRIAIGNNEAVGAGIQNQTVTITYYY